MSGSEEHRHLTAVSAPLWQPAESECVDPLLTDADLLADLAQMGLIQEGAETLVSPPELTVMTALLCQGLELDEVHRLVTLANRLAEHAGEQLQAEIAGIGSGIDDGTALTLAKLVCADVLTHGPLRLGPETGSRRAPLRLVPPADVDLRAPETVRRLPG